MKLFDIIRAATPPKDEAGAAMERYAAGDDAAFADLYDLLKPRLYAYLVRRTRDLDQAEDLLQQTLLQVHRARGSFIPGADVLPWVFAIARRLVIDSVRKTKREVTLASDVDLANVAAAAGFADDVVQAQQLKRRLERALERLPEPQRIAFELLKRRGLSLSETAECLHITVGAVKLRLFRAQEALRAALDAPEDPP
jgi:RNA polymerase sigma-70 factor (ECF subfamily)